MSAAPGQDPVLSVLGYSALAAGSAVLGTVPYLFRRRVRRSWVGWSYALASGLMLGAAYILLAEGLAREVVAPVVGAGLGVAFTYWTHAYTGASELAAREAEGTRGDRALRFVLLHSLHAASEGIAIGAAMLVDHPLGAFMAAALATHNVAEALVLTDVLRSAGTPLLDAAGLCWITRIPQVLLAIVAFAVTPAVPGLLPWVLGFAGGAMGYLVLTELLPESYERAGRTGIAVVVTLAAGGVLFLRTVLL